MAVKSRITHRIWSLSAVAVLVIAGLCAATLMQMRAAQDAGAAVDHTSEVIAEATFLLARIADAETTQRGYLLTHGDEYARLYEDYAGQRGEMLARLKALTIDNTVQQTQLAQLEHAVADKFLLMDQILKLAQSGRGDEALAMVREGGSNRAMELVRHSFASIIAVERSLLEKRRAEAEDIADRVVKAVTFGGFFAALLIVLACWRVAYRLHASFSELLSGIGTLTSGDLEYRITLAGDDEAAQIARAFNRMAGNLADISRVRDHAEGELQQMNAELLNRSAEIEQRNGAIDLLGRMAHRLQAARTEEEFGEVISRFVPQILPTIPGALYLINNSRNLMVRAAEWMEPRMAPQVFAPDDCWGLRRGQFHHVITADTDVCCEHVGQGHVGQGAVAGYVCLPLLAQGDIVGLLYLESPTIPGLGGAGGYDYTAVLGENVALALVNHRLRESLKEQSIRDALTGLFNRRYLEEAAQLEFARASRSHVPVGVLMIDIDHFKKFNDTHGHDAGDHLLRVVAQTLQTQVREGDIVCRYGGEEFTVLLPGATQAQVAERAEMLRTAVRAQVVTHHGQLIGNVSISVGLAMYSEHGHSFATVLAAADAALYQAKHAGRDRVMVAPSPVSA